MYNIKNIKYIVIYILILNLISFILFFIDKKRALKDKWRIKESTLHLCSFLGGSIGSITAMYMFHHKTKKLKFCIITGLALVFNIIVLSAFFFDYTNLLSNIL